MTALESENIVHRYPDLHSRWSRGFDETSSAAPQRDGSGATSPDARDALTGYSPEKCRQKEVLLHEASGPRTKAPSGAFQIANTRKAVLSDLPPFASLCRIHSFCVPTQLDWVSRCRLRCNTTSASNLRAQARLDHIHRKMSSTPE